MEAGVERVYPFARGTGPAGGPEKLEARLNDMGGDDSADALRYLVATKSRTVTQRKLRGL